MESHKIIILGATGNIGSATVKTLAALKANVTAGVRDPSKAKDLEAAGAKVVKADMGQSQQELTKVLAQYNAVYIVTPGHIDRTKLAINAIKASQDAKVNYVLALSVPPADNLDTIFGRQFNPIERELKSSGLNYGLIRLPMFIENIFGNAPSIKSHNTFYGPVDGSIKFVTVAIQDAALAATKILQSPYKHINKTYTITSDFNCPDEQAKIYSRAIGRDIKYLNANYDGTKKALLEILQEWMADGVLELYKLAEKRDPSQITFTNDFMTITGQEPTSHSEWIKHFTRVF